MAFELHDLLRPVIYEQRRGRVEVADEKCRQIVAVFPHFWEAVYLHATILLQLSRPVEAIELFERIAQERPGVADVHNNLGVAYQAIGDWQRAEAEYQAAIDTAEGCPRASLNLGWLLGSQGRNEEAERVVRSGVLRHPENLDLRVDHAHTLIQLERLDEATDVYREVVTRRPHYHQVHSSLAFVLERQGRLDEALAAAERAIELCPDYADAFNNLGIVLRSMHRLDDACTAFRQALSLTPDFALAEFNLGTTFLLAGRYSEGWEGYRQYARIAGTGARDLPVPEWDGRPIPGRRLLVQADQGFGDAIQFARFLPRAKAESGAVIVFRCQPALARLFAGFRGVDELVATDVDEKALDLHVSLASLPGLFGVTLETAGLGVPYLEPRLLPRVEMADRLRTGTEGTLRVGLVWQGNPRQTRDFVRSCPLEKLARLLATDGIIFYSLQTDDPGRRQIVKLGLEHRLIDVGSLLGDFAETAAIVAELDLVITVDTATAHLAGAMGRPVWTMLCHTPDWRWHLERSDSPWYPTMRLFRQLRWGDWDAVVDEIRANLANLTRTNKT